MALKLSRRYLVVEEFPLQGLAAVQLPQLVQLRRLVRVARLEALRRHRHLVDESESTSEYGREVTRGKRAVGEQQKKRSRLSKQTMESFGWKPRELL